MRLQIGALSEQTGVSVHVLRSWERRYGLFKPVRTSGGFRLYDEGDAGRIRAMRALMAGGVSASEAAKQVLESGRDAPADPAGSGGTTTAAARHTLHDAMREFDDGALEAAIDSVLSALDLDSAIRDVLLPELREVGEDWSAGRLSVAQEHFSLNVIRGRLMGLARGWDRGFGPRALLACPPGEHHDVSLILFGLALRSRGWRVTFLGADTPIAEVRRAQAELSPEVTVLFAAAWIAQENLVAELAAPGCAPILLAGISAGPIAAAAGCRWLSQDPVSEAESLTSEFAALPSAGAR